MNANADNVKRHNVVKLDSVDWEFEFEVGSTKVSAKGAYQDDYDNWMARCPIPGSPHPDIPALKLKKISAKRKEGYLIDVTLSYECNNPDANYPGRKAAKIKRYWIEPTTTEEPLLTADYFKDLTSTEKRALSELLASSKEDADFAKAQAAMTDNPEPGALAITLIEKGQDSYRWSGLIWVEKFTTNKLSDAELWKILKTTSSPPGDPPDIGADRNWLRLAPNVTPHDDGETWDIENRWEASLPGKWQANIYPASE